MGKFAFDAVAGEPVAEVQREYRFSLYSSLADTSPQTVTLSDLLMLLREGEFAQQIVRIRGEPDEERQKALKRMLPCVAVSGEFAGGHQAVHLVRHSGLICIDLDADKNPCMLGCAAEWRDRLVKDEFVRMAFLSARGNGVAVICRIEAERHAEAFEGLQAYFKGRHGLVIDTSCRDVPRMRFLSWDPDVAENFHARTFKRYALAGGGGGGSALVQEFISAGVGGEDGGEDGGRRTDDGGQRGSAVGAAAMVLSGERREEILSALERISPDDRQAWLDVGMAIQSEVPGLEGFNLWRRWSEFNDTGAKFNEPDLDRVWRSFKRSGMRIETLFKMAYLAGWKGPIAPKRVTGSLPVITADVWLAAKVPPRDPVIDGLMDAGTFGELIAPSKCKKSFSAMQIAICIASGMKFLIWPVPKPRRVLLINVELLADRAHDRASAMTGGLGTPREDLSRLLVSNIRGMDIPDCVGAICATIREHRPEVTIIDPLYLIHEENESDPVAMTALYKRLAATQCETRSAILIVHHDAKGKAGDRDKRDRGAGSGIMGRFCDTRILLTPHKDDPDHLICVETMYRYMPPQPGITMRYENGCLVVAEEECVPETSTKAVKVLKSDEVLEAAIEAVVPDIIANGPYPVSSVSSKLTPLGVTNCAKRAEGVKRLRALAALPDSGFEFLETGKYTGWFGTRVALLSDPRTKKVRD